MKHLLTRRLELWRLQDGGDLLRRSAQDRPPHGTKCKTKGHLGSGGRNTVGDGTRKPEHAQIKGWGSSGYRTGEEKARSSSRNQCGS